MKENNFNNNLELNKYSVKKYKNKPIKLKKFPQNFFILLLLC